MPHPSDAPAIENADAHPAPPVHRPSLHLHWWVCLLVITADQAAKAAVYLLLPLFESVAVIPGYVDFIHVQNTGVAFGLLTDLDGSYRSTVTTTLAVVALAGIIYYARHLRPDEWVARLGLSFILGGAMGNLIDRVRVGHVIDFVDVYWADWHFWAFNLADTSITIGAILVFVDLLVVNRHVSHSV